MGKITTDPSANLPEDPSRRQLFESIAALGASQLVPATVYGAADQAAHSQAKLDQSLHKYIKNVVVIYLENRSFNNLFATFPGLQSPLIQLDFRDLIQRDRNGQPLTTLPKIWGGLVQRGQTEGGKHYYISENQISGLPNHPFILMDAHGKQLPENIITRDLVHAFYQNQMQINGGKNDKFVAWGDSGALVMGRYQGDNLNLWNIARQYTLCDCFHMGAFGGSYLNHQFLIAARPSVYHDAVSRPAKKKIAVLEDGPTGYRLAMAADSPVSAMEGPPKFVNNGTITPDGYVINTMAPPYQPSYIPPASAGNLTLADPDNISTLPPQTHLTIGDLLSQKNVSWAWYGGGWQAALNNQGGPESPNFQSHHQPFNYYQQYAPGTEARKRHLRDGGLGESPISNYFIADTIAGRLPDVAFYKPQGNLNLHAGYASIALGDAHVANVLQHLMAGPQWKNMMVIITFDENGGWWDHVPPPKGDRWGPGSRVPAIIASPFAKKGVVDHTFYDTTSIIRFLSRRYSLPLLDGIQQRNAAFQAHKTTPPGDLVGTLQFV